MWKNFFKNPMPNRLHGHNRHLLICFGKSVWNWRLQTDWKDHSLQTSLRSTCPRHARCKCLNLCVKDSVLHPRVPFQNLCFGRFHAWFRGLQKNRFGPKKTTYYERKLQNRKLSPWPVPKLSTPLKPGPETIPLIPKTHLKQGPEATTPSKPKPETVPLIPKTP